MTATLVQLVVFRCRTCELQNLIGKGAPVQVEFESFSDALTHVMDNDHHTVIAIVAPE